MATQQKKASRLTRAMLETADGMRRVGILDAKSHEKITLRHLGKNGRPKIDAITGRQIRALRQRAHVSQAVFAKHLNVTVGYVSQLERGAKRATGAALALLNVIRRKGFDAIL